MRFLVFVAILLQTYLTVSGSEVPFATCESPLFIPNSVTVTPYPVKLFGKLAVDMEGIWEHSTVSGGRLDYEVAYRWRRNPDRYVSVDDNKENVCRRARCPFKPGPIKFEYRYTLLPILAPGLYRVKTKVTTYTGVTMLCCVLYLDFVFPFEHEKQSLIT